MSVCPKCHTEEAIQRAGFVRGKQRFFCKSCEYHFIEEHQEKVSRKSNQTTIVDIANYLGISPSTVSRALTGKYDINPNTRAEILRVARELDYQPNLLAQGLIHRETHTLGVIIPNIERPFFASVVSGIQQVATESGYRVMICQSNESHQTEIANVQALVASRVDGLLICHSKETTSFEHIRIPFNRGIPIIHFDRVCEEIDTPKVLLNDYEGAKSVVEHLIEQGCRKIAVLAGPEHLSISKKRIKGYQDAIKVHKITKLKKDILHGNFRKESTIEALNYWLSQEEKPDAIFCVYYVDAIEVILELKRRGIKIPTEIAVAGFGDEWLADVIEPSLTTYNLHPFEVGYQTAKLFLERILHPENQILEPITIKGDLIIRQSSLKSNK